MLEQLLKFDSSNKSCSNEFDDKFGKSTKKRYLRKVVKYGSTVQWVHGRHYDASDLENYRLVGDVELDRLLEVGSKEYEEAGSGSGSGSGSGATHGSGGEGTQKSIKLDGRFTNTISFCRDVYHRCNCQHENIDMIMVQNLTPAEKLGCEFYRHYHDFVPKWVDWDQIQRGMDVYITYSPMASHGLFYFSLIPGFSIPKIAKVLERTRYLSPPSKKEQIMNRLMDTGGFLMNVMLSIPETSLDPDNDFHSDSDSESNQNHNPDGTNLSAGPLRPGGKAWTMALQVRTLHAKVRRSILKQNQGNKNAPGDKWNIDEYGIPINQEDMAGTLLAFSVNVLASIEFIAGRPLPIQVQLDYLALWRYVGWLLGIESQEGDYENLDSSIPSTNHVHTNDLDPLDPCGSCIVNGQLYHDEDDTGDDIDNAKVGPIVHARALLESIILHLMHPNDSSRKIAHHLLCMGYHDGQSSKEGKSSTMSFGYLYRSYMCRRYIGEQLADELKIPNASNIRSVKEVSAWLLTYIFLMISRVYTLLIMHSMKFRQWAYARHFRVMRNFDKIWSEKHGIRMQKAAQDAMGGKAGARPGPGSEVAVSIKTAKSTCPFALVMPPVDSEGDCGSTERESFDKKKKFD